MEERVYVPYIQVRENALVVFEQPEPPYSHRRHDLTRIKTYQGTVTDSAAKRIKRTVDVFLQRSPERWIFNTVTKKRQKFRLNFITLTIPHPVPLSARETHKALKIFIQHFKATPAKKAISEQLTSYLWKCELQARGQIHYHITTNRFLHLAEINRVWNGIMFRRGWLDDFKARHGHTAANSTDVHAVYKVRDIQAYLSKYLAKDGRRDVSEYGFAVPIFEPKIDGKIWDASQDLKIPRFADEMDCTTRDRIQNAIDCGQVRKLDFEQCTVFATDRPTDLLSISSLKQYIQWKK